MQNFTTYFACPSQDKNTSVAAAVKRALVHAGIHLYNEMEAMKVAILAWLPKTPQEEIQEALATLKTYDLRIIILNLQPSLHDAVKWLLLKSGASDIIDWTGNEESLATFIKLRMERWAVVENILQMEEIKNHLVGESICWKKLLRKIIETAYYTSANMLICGESGTGKEATASLLHLVDQRQNKPSMVLLDCTTISPELSGSEFYGHEKGAFTNAIATREGAFELANNGTLFLDEMGELPLTMQAGLLRVIQEKTFKRVGSNNWRSTAFRLVAATNRDLKKEIEAGRFRNDLYYRIASSVFVLPTLHERREDIPELIRHFLRSELKTVVAPDIDPLLMSYLVHKKYPGNIRELKQLVAQIAMRYTGQGFIAAGDLPEEQIPCTEELANVQSNQNSSLHQSLKMAIASGKDLAKIKSDIALMAMEIALEESGGNLKIAARKLNVEVRTLQYIRQKNNGANV